jgi:hypothetical protein
LQTLNGKPKRSAIFERTASPAQSVDFNAGLFAAQFLQSSPFIGLNPIDFSNFIDQDETNGNTPEPAQALQLDAQELPSSATMMELFNLFFQKIHPLLPCLYRKSVMADLSSGDLTKPNALTYSILSIAAYIHQDPAIKAASERWHTLAKEHFNSAVVNGRFSLRCVQAGIYTSLRLYGTAKISEGWIFFSSVWRMCLPLGLHTLDSSRGAFPGFLPHPRSEQDLEERRRAIWAVYIFDRLSSYAVGWPMCVNDREFCVNFPAPEETFQSGSIEVSCLQSLVTG